MNNDFQVQEWEVWHTYSTYLDCPGIEGMKWLTRFVQYKICDVNDLIDWILTNCL